MNKKPTDVQLNREEQQEAASQSTTQPRRLFVVRRDRRIVGDKLPTNERRQVTLVISPGKIAFTLALVVLCLLLGHVITRAVIFFSGHNTIGGLIPQFDLNGEANIPTWYSSSALLLASALLAMIAIVKLQWQETYARHWVGLAAVFLYLSIDEAARFHEMGSTLALLIIPSIVDFANLSPAVSAVIANIPSYTWVVFGAFFVLLFSLAYLRFLIHLPVRTRSLFVLAGILYVGGALGVELLGAWSAYLHGGETTLEYAMLVLWEEGFEMIGIVVFIYALTSYLGPRLTNLRIRVAG